MKNKMDILYKEKKSEFEVQAELFIKLKKLFSNTCFDVKGEFKVKKTKNIRGARLDLVIFKNKKAVCIIEVKARGNIPVDQLKQTIRYKKIFKLPVLLCRGTDNIIDTILDVKELFFYN